jgi:hypothetical protein
MWWLLMQAGLIKPVRPTPPTNTGFGPWFGLGVIGFVYSLFWLGWWGLVPAVACLAAGSWLDARRGSHRR